MNSKAIVMGRNYASLLGMIRSIGMAGCDVFVIHTMRKYNLKSVYPDKVSKYVKKWTYAIEPDREDLIKKILNFSVKEEKVILLPTDDFTASTIDSHKMQLEDGFLFPYVKGGKSIDDLMDKKSQKDLAKECGLNVATSYSLENQNGKYQIPDSISYPCFPKPQISFMGDKTCMKKCNTRQELEYDLDQVAAKYNCPVLVEQYNPINQEYGVLGVSDGTGIVIPALVHKLKIGHGHHEGVTLLGKVMTFEGYEIVRKELQELVKKTGFVGLFDIDLYESNGVIYFNEINFRLGAFGFAILCDGINLPKILAEGLCGGIQDDYDIQVKKEITCLSEKVNFEDYVAGYIDKTEYQSNLAQADDYFINVPYDRKPYWAFWMKTRSQRIKKMIKHK